MTQKARRGKIILLVYIALVLLTSAGLVALYVFSKGKEQAPARVARLALTALLCFYLFKGSKVAKFLSVVLFTLGGALALPLVLQGTLPAVAGGGGLAALYLSFASVLLWSESVNAFMSHQRGEVAVDRGSLDETQEEQGA
jgi:peptidoglycan/LPS O-acetylase OafA/YrhL